MHQFDLAVVGCVVKPKINLIIHLTVDTSAALVHVVNTADRISFGSSCWFEPGHHALPFVYFQRQHICEDEAIFRHALWQACFDQETVENESMLIK